MLLHSINRCLVVVAVVLICYAVIHVKPVLLPLLMAILIALVLSPIHRALCRLRMPEPLAAAVVMTVLLSGMVAGGFHLSSPAVEWATTIDLEYAEERVREVFLPVKEVQKELEDVAEKVDSIAKGGDAEENEAESDPVVEENGKKRKRPVEVEIRERPTNQIIAAAQSFGAHAVATLLLIFFFLAYGRVLYSRLNESKGTATVVESLGSDVSAYLFTITAINAGLGACIAVAMWWLDMPNPVLWGVMGCLFNFVPYIGALAGTAIVGVVAIVTFSTPAEALLVPIVYFALTALEGNVVTPMLIGRRFALNPIIVVVWFIAWGAMWGLPGLLIATPTLMACKIVCENIPELSRIDRVISR